MAGGDAVRAQAQGGVQQGPELQAAVAVDAGVRRAARAVFAHETVHHLAREALALVEDVKGHTEALGDLPRAGNIVSAERQRRACTFIALLL